MPDPELDLWNSHKRRMQRLAHRCTLSTPKEDRRQREMLAGWSALPRDRNRNDSVLKTRWKMGPRC